LNRLLISYLVIFSVVSFSQTHISDKFIFRAHTFNETTLPYRLFIPENYDSSKSYPLVLCLHGSGESGTDNYRQITTNRLATSWADSINQSRNPCFVVAPQCPDNNSWHDFLATANNIIDTLILELNIDTTRLYITGLSMGGFGTWEQIAKTPDRYAAAIPMSGGADTSIIQQMIHIPIWNFHGRVDPIVSVSFSRNIISKLSIFGREVVYTHCNLSDCMGLEDTTILNLINNGTDLLYTEYQNGGHEIWDESYNNPLLMEWVFKQYKIPNSIAISNLEYYKILNNNFTINWSSEKTDGTVDIYYSHNNDKDWQSLAKRYPNSGSFDWNTENFMDSYFGLIKIVIRDENGFVYDYNQSNYFSVNNPAEGKPYVKIVNEVSPNFVFSEPEFKLDFLAGDPDNDSLEVSIYYTPDSGENLYLLDNSKTVSDTNVQTKIVNWFPVQNSVNAALGILVDDGNSTEMDFISGFGKINQRSSFPESNIHYISKFADVPLQINLVDNFALSGDEYILTFDDFESDFQKYFSVYNSTKGNMVLENIPFNSGNESMIFDGLSFLAEDIYTKNDPIRSKWNEGVSKTLNFTFTPFFLNDNYPEYNGYGKPNDYKIIFYGTTVDTSVADTLFPVTPSNTFPAKATDFKIFNTTENKKVDFVFSTTGILAKNYNIWLKEEVKGTRERTWRINIVDNEPARQIPAGDSLYLYSYKGLSIYDTIKINSIPLRVRDNKEPSGYYLSQNYPNPFNPTTTIEYSIPERTIVKIIVFDILGRKISTLINEVKEAGDYRLEFNAAYLPSGVYFYRIETDEFIQTKKFLFLK
jgi:poly(3-hydroxybutyrate) depolymerase